MFTVQFWKDATERAVKTAAQSVLLFLIGNKVAEAASVNAFDVDWKTIGGFAIGGLVISYCFSLLSAPFGDKGTPSLTRE